MVLHDDTHHDNPELEEHHILNLFDNQIIIREQNRDNLRHEESQEEFEYIALPEEETENELHEYNESIRLGRFWDFRNDAE